MAKRPDPRRIRSALTYTVAELAIVLSVTNRTVRSMIQRGLPTLSAKRPTLILGADAKEFLTVEQANAKSPLAANELYCFSCKAPRRPFGNLVDLVDLPDAPARITGLCEVCERTCNRIVRRDQIDELRGIFDVTLNNATRA